MKSENFFTVYSTLETLSPSISKTLPNKRLSIVFERWGGFGHCERSDKQIQDSGFAYGRSETSPDCEEIERNARMCKERNFPSVEQIQDRARVRGARIYPLLTLRATLSQERERKFCVRSTP